jgi:hypothetical protein
MHTESSRSSQSRIPFIYHWIIYVKSSKALWSYPVSIWRILRKPVTKQPTGIPIKPRQGSPIIPWVVENLIRNRGRPTIIGEASDEASHMV